MVQGLSTKINSMIKWIRTSRLSIKNSVATLLSVCRDEAQQSPGRGKEPAHARQVRHHHGHHDTRRYTLYLYNKIQIVTIIDRKD